MVKGDLLGDAFGVSAFHRCQVNNLLRGQLIPYNPDNPPDKAVVTSFGSPGCGVTIREMPVPVTSIKGEAAAPENLAGTAAGLPLPAFPALSKAQTLPAGSNFGTGVVRKRSDSDCEAENVKPKLARSEDGTVIVKTSPRHRCKVGPIRTSLSLWTMFKCSMHRIFIRSCTKKCLALYALVAIATNHKESGFATLFSPAIVRQRPRPFTARRVGRQMRSNQRSRARMTLRRIRRLIMTLLNMSPRLVTRPRDLHRYAPTLRVARLGLALRLTCH